MKKKQNTIKTDAFAPWFLRSRRMGLGERFFSFLFTIGCGYAASYMLDMAMAQQRDGLIRAGAVLLALLAVGLPVSWFLTRQAERTRLQDRQRFREELYRRILTNCLEVSSVGEQEQLLGNISDQVADQYQIRIPQTVEGLCIIVGAAALMCLERPSIAILFPLMGFMQMIPVFTYEKWTKKIYEESWDSDEAETDWIAQGVDGARTLKAYGAERWFVGRYRQINRRGIEIGNKAITTGGLESILYASINAILRYGSYGILGLYVLYGGLPASSLPILVVLGSYVFSSMDKLFTFVRYRGVWQLAIERLREALRPEQTEGAGDVLRAEKIAKAFGDKQVLRGVSFCIRDGERVLLGGANGSGKSTLIRILLGEITPDTGTVQVGARLAVALQSDPELSISAASFLEALKGQPDWHIERFQAYLQGFHFPEELLRHPTRELSGGERKKLFLAVALARDSELLILDEPTNHMDAESREYLKRRLAEYGGAMLVCTHDPDFCLDWDKTVYLEGGVSQ